MKLSLTTFLLFAVLANVQAKMVQTSSPLAKVIELLQGNLAKGQEEKQKEVEMFQTYDRWCQDTQVENENSIQKANDQIDEDKATVASLTSKVERLQGEIASHETDVAAYQGDEKAAMDVRKIEHNSYLAVNQNADESLAALDGAINLLKEQSSRDGLFLIQLKNKIPEDKLKGLMAFLAEKNPIGATPEVADYEFQSHGIVQMLEQLKREFKDEKNANQNKETQRKDEHDALMKLLDGMIKDRKKRITDKTETIGKHQEEIGNRKKSIADETADRDAAQKTLEEVTTTCAQKSTDFDARQKLRAEELQAIEKAITILQSDDISGSAKRQGVRSFVQLRSVHKNAPTNAAQIKVAQFLAQQSKILSSHKLAALALHVEADPFIKVRKLITDLVAKLKKQEKEELGHKAFCDEELAKNKATREAKENRMEVLSAKIEELGSQENKLKESIDTLSAEMTDLKKQQKEATETRHKENDENTATIKDAKAAQAALARAIKVLNEFYGQAAGATALVQQPEIFDTAYTGMQSENKGVMGLLEVIQSDFSRLENETTAEEAQNAKDFKEFMSDAKASHNAKMHERQSQELNLQETTQEKELTTEDLDATTEEHKGALQVYESLKPQCVVVAVDYDERVKQREAELDSLREAWEILDNNGKE